jgi:hypothetical protein
MRPDTNLLIFQKNELPSSYFSGLEIEAGISSETLHASHVRRQYIGIIDAAVRSPDVASSLPLM